MIEPQQRRHCHSSENYWLVVVVREGAADVEREPSFNFDIPASKARQE
jgi:hypothetical protein